jgi:HSP20 family protein
MPAKSVDLTAGRSVLEGADRLSMTRSTTTRWVVIGRSHLWRPPTDVYETEEAFVIQVEVAGMRGADFAVSVQDRRVAIGGVRHDNGEARAYHQMEIHHGEFRTDVELPGSFDREAMQAEYNDGFLRIVLPKSRAHRIDVT